MSVLHYATLQHPTSPVIKAVVIYDGNAVHGVHEIKYETEWMDIETFVSEYPISIKSFDKSSELDSLLYGLDECYRDPKKVTILFYKQGSEEEIPYMFDPRQTYLDDHA